MKNLFTAFTALCIISLVTCGTVISAEKYNAAPGKLPASSQAKDQAAIEKQRKQQKQAAEQNASNLGSAATDVSSTQKKKKTVTGAKTSGQPATGLPDPKD